MKQLTVTGRDTVAGNYSFVTIYEDIDGDGTADHYQTVLFDPQNGNSAQNYVLDHLSGDGAQYWAHAHIRQRSSDTEPPKIDSILVSDVAVKATATATIPTDTSISVTIHEDTDGDGNSDNSTTVDLEDGYNEITIDDFDGGAGNDYWANCELHTDRGSKTPELGEIGVRTTLPDTVTTPDPHSYRWTGASYRFDSNTSNYWLRGFGYWHDELRFETQQKFKWELNAEKAQSQHVTVSEDYAIFPYVANGDDYHVAGDIYLAASDAFGYSYDTQTSLETFPTRLIEAPDGDVYALADDGVRRLDSSDGTTTATNTDLFTTDAQPQWGAYLPREDVLAVYFYNDAGPDGLVEYDPETLDVLADNRSSFDIGTVDTVHFDPDGSMYALADGNLHTITRHGNATDTGTAAENLTVGNEYIYTTHTDRVAFRDRTGTEQDAVYFENIDFDFLETTRGHITSWGDLLITSTDSDPGTDDPMIYYDSEAGEITQQHSKNYKPDAWASGTYASNPDTWENDDSYQFTIEEIIELVAAGLNLSNDTINVGTADHGLDRLVRRSQGGLTL